MQVLVVSPGYLCQNIPTVRTSTTEWSSPFPRIAIGQQTLAGYQSHQGMPQTLKSSKEAGRVGMERSKAAVACHLLAARPLRWTDRLMWG